MTEDIGRLPMFSEAQEMNDVMTVVVITRGDERTFDLGEYWLHPKTSSILLSNISSKF